MGVIQSCKPRPEVLTGQLDDALFAASLGKVVIGSAPPVYADARKFLENTYPTKELKGVCQTVFRRLSDPNEPGALVRLSTSFGGGKTHALLALWHLANQSGNTKLGADIVPPELRPQKVRVVALDCEGAGYPVFATHRDCETKSLAAEIAYQLGGRQAVDLLGDAALPGASPNQAQIERLLPDDPLLLMIDELALYLDKLQPHEQNNLVGFLATLATALDSRPQAALVVTDPGTQTGFAETAAKVQGALQKLEAVMARKFYGMQAAGDEAAEIIVRRLFESVDRQAAAKTAQRYLALYARVLENTETQDCLPAGSTGTDAAAAFDRCYPFHPDLVRTVRERLGSLPTFQQGRGTLRLFARIVRKVWDAQDNLELIDAGALDWSDGDIRTELLDRLQVQGLKAAAEADALRHAGELDGGTRGVHSRVAAALLLESLTLDDNSGFTPQELTHAVLRLDETGREPSEALDRLLGVCWYLYPAPSGNRFQFKVQSNVLRQIEDKAGSVSRGEAEQLIQSRVVDFFRGALFQVAQFPRSVDAAPRSARLTLALCWTQDLAQEVARYESVKEGTKTPRVFCNCFLALGPDETQLGSAVELARKVHAARALSREAQSQKDDAARVLLKMQLDRILPAIEKQFRIQAVRAFSRLFFPDKRSYTLDSTVFGQDENALADSAKGQEGLFQFLRDQKLLFDDTDRLDSRLFLTEVFASTIEAPEGQGARTMADLQERILAANLGRLVPNETLLRNTVREMVSRGELVVRLADGRAFDQAGCVANGIHPGERVRRADQLPANLPVTKEALVALPSSPAAQLWLKESGGEAPDPDGVEPPPPPPPAVTGRFVTDWQSAFERSQSERVVRVTLRANDPELIQAMLRAAVKLSPNRRALSATIDGLTKEGGTIRLALQGLSPTNPIGPEALVSRLHNALEQVQRCEVELALGFDESRTDVGTLLPQAHGELGDDGSVRVEVEFA